MNQRIWLLLMIFLSWIILGLSDLNEDAVKTKFTDEGIEIRIENYKEIY